jgi:hypothetical protein
MSFTPAFPPTDVGVRDHLLHAPGTGQEEDCKLYLKSFLCSLFMSAHLRAGQLFPADKIVSYVVLAKTFYDFFKDVSQRNDFYQAVILHTSDIHSMDVWESFRVFENGLKQCCSDWPVKSTCPLLISIDEVHLLHTLRHEDIGSSYTLYSRLKSVLSEGVAEDLCTIVLSTATHTSELAPSKEVAPSMRERDDERFLPAPFTELPFDAHIIAEPLSPGQATLNTVGTLEFTAKFGRPL